MKANENELSADSRLVIFINTKQTSISIMDIIRDPYKELK